MCPNAQKPSGVVKDNAFLTCPEAPDVPAIYVNPNVPGCADDLTQVNNSVNTEEVVEMPQVSFRPPPPTSTDVSGVYPVIGVTRTQGATIRYTVDGSRPSEDSPEVPKDGVILSWPGPAVAINMRAFRAGARPSVTNGAILELNYILGRQAPRTPVGALAGRMDSLTLTDASGSVKGWAVDSALPGGGLAPIAVAVRVDFSMVAVCLADVTRPDLVDAKVAPNPQHGYICALPAAAVETLQTGTHAIDVVAIGSPSTEQPQQLQGGPFCVSSGVESDCNSPSPSISFV